MKAVRFKATRPVYRRGGLVLSAADWVEVAPEQLGKASSLALLEDPVVLVEILAAGEDGPEWVRFEGEDRQAAVTYGRANLTEEVEAETVATELQSLPAAPPPSPAPQPPSPPSPPPPPGGRKGGNKAPK